MKVRLGLTKTSDNFEETIARFHKLLEREDSVITWNDKIPDPDNVSRLRQIDISIRRDDFLTIIECRIHKKIQDVKWVEELIGRRVSLGADTIIGVSNSGFTAGAIAKAKAFGVILRDLNLLSDFEISAWGLGSRVYITYLEFQDISLQFEMPASNDLEKKLSSAERYVRKSASNLVELFQQFVNSLGDKFKIDFTCPCKARFLTNSPLLIDKYQVNAVNFSANVTLKSVDYHMASVLAYGEPGIDFEERSVFYEKVQGIGIEITKAKNRASVIVDVSQLPILRNGILRDLRIDFGQIMEANVEVVGIPEFEIPIDELSVGVLDIE